MKYGIYVISKNRTDKCLTAINFIKMNIPFTLVVDEDEYDKYYQIFNGKCEIIAFPKKEYEEKYETLDNFGTDKPVGPGAKRNFVWDLSIDRKEDMHFVCDDNIEIFLRRTGNCHFIARDNKFFYEMVDFIEKAELNNVKLFGPEYSFFVPANSALKAFKLNSRIFSVIGIINDLPIRWRGRYNEDVILSFDCLNLGFATLSFMTHLQKKVITQKLKGGNTDVFYSQEGTLLKTSLLSDNFKKFTKEVFKYGRIHHEFDFSIFKNNLLRKTTNIKEDIKYLDVDYLTYIWNQIGAFVFSIEKPCQLVINFMSIEERELFINKLGINKYKKIAKSVITSNKKPAALTCWWLSCSGFTSSKDAKKIFKIMQLEKIKKLKCKEEIFNDKNLV